MQHAPCLLGGKRGHRGRGMPGLTTFAPSQPEQLRARRIAWWREQAPYSGCGRSGVVFLNVSAPSLSARRPCECDLSSCCWLHEFTRLVYLFSSGTALTYHSKVHSCGEDAVSTSESRQTSSVCENVIARAGSSRPRSMSARRLADTISECPEGHSRCRVRRSGRERQAPAAVCAARLDHARVLRKEVLAAERK